MNKWFVKLNKQEEYKLWRFKELDLSDKDLYNYYIKQTEHPANVWSANFTYLWAHTQSSKLKIYRATVFDMLVTFILTKKGRLYMPCLPFGKGNVDKIMHVLLICSEFCFNWNQDSHYQTMSTVIPLNQAQLDYLKTSPLYDNFFMTEDLTGLERHYSIPLLLDLKGKDFSSIRNKLNHFHKHYPNAIVRKYTDDDFLQVMKLGEIWEEKSGKNYRRIFDDFYFESIVRNHKALEHIIIVVELNGKIIGMTTGEILPTGEAWGCLTKYNNTYRGLSEKLTIEIVKEIHNKNPHTEYLNVGSDLGKKGLAFAKERYRPILNYKRYALFFKKSKQS